MRHFHLADLSEFHRKKGLLERTSRDYNLIENQIDLLTFLIIHRARILWANRLGQDLNPAGEEMR